MTIAIKKKKQSCSIFGLTQKMRQKFHDDFIIRQLIKAVTNNSNNCGLLGYKNIF